MLIRSKFEGKCRTCSAGILRGDIVEYTPPEKGVRCNACYSTSAANPDPRSAFEPPQEPVADPRTEERIGALETVAGQLNTRLVEHDERIGKRERALGDHKREVDEKLAAIAAQVKNSTPLKIELHEPLKPVKTLDNVHAMFPTLLTVASARVNAFLVGPAGSGKSVGGEKLAEALDLPFYCVSIGPQTTTAQVFGYMNASGNYVTTPVRQGVEFGGVVCIDELDRGNPGTLTSLNALTSGNVIAFPDKMVTKHPNCIIIATANTWGTGATREYVGANQLDSATLDRFKGQIEWNYDETFERSLTDRTDWFDIVVAFRKRVADLGIRRVVSMRATVEGTKLLHAGMPIEQVKSMVLERGLSESDIARIAS